MFKKLSIKPIFSQFCPVCLLKYFSHLHINSAGLLFSDLGFYLIPLPWRLNLSGWTNPHMAATALGPSLGPQDSESPHFSASSPSSALTLREWTRSNERVTGLVCWYWLWINQWNKQEGYRKCRNSQCYSSIQSFYSSFYCLF